ncbi:hypothetical protein LTR66_008573 [Elasticomyces elasticus]|nr:hypothetical protein LTR66_008573 [Elasticomyces elasticus]
MAATRRAPLFPPPSFLGHPRHQPLPGHQLPPLLIPDATARPVLPVVPSLPASFVLPPIQTAPAPVPRTAARRDADRAVPVEKLLSGQPYTPQTPNLPSSSHYGPPMSPRSARIAKPSQMRFAPAPPAGDAHQRHGSGHTQPTTFATTHLRHASGPSSFQTYTARGTPYARLHSPDASVSTHEHSPAISPYERAQDVEPPLRPQSGDRHVQWHQAQEPHALYAPLPSPVVPASEPTHDYALNIRQQPIAARACGFGERDRRVIDPPPILQLQATSRATQASDPQELKYQLFVVHCSLMSHAAEHDEPETAGSHGRQELPLTRRLMGTLVSSPFAGVDERDEEGTFFVFADMSCRSPGKYKLHFSLLRLDPTRMMLGGRQLVMAEVVSDVFEVFSAKEFPGMRASSALLIALRRQGLSVGVKKGSEAIKARRSRRESDDEDEDDDTEDVEEDSARHGAEDAEGLKTNRRAKARRKRKKNA